MLTFSQRCVVFGMMVAAAAVAAPAQSVNPDLAKFFGWDEPRILVVDRGAGPSITADFNGDGLIDIAVVNNSKSRIELHLQRKVARTAQEVEREYKVNELVSSPYYDRVEVSVAHRVGALKAFDIDEDGLLDLLYVGVPDELVILRQTELMKFDLLSKRRIRGLTPGQDSLEIADVLGDSAPELLAISSGRIHIYGLSKSAVTGEPVQLGTGESSQEIVAFFVEDYNGDGLLDVMAAIPEDPSPVRLWLQGSVSSSGSKEGQLGPELRFEMPALRELEPVRIPGQNAASIAVIERASRRIVLLDLKTESSDETETSTSAKGKGSGGDRDAPAEVFAFPGAANKSRSIVVADLDGDGSLDLLSTDQQANTLVLYRQQKGIGLSSEQRFSALKDPKTIAVGQWDTDAELEVFVLSEADKVVGISQYDAVEQRLSFPQPIQLATAGASPVAMGYAGLKNGPALAVIVKDKRDHTLEIHRPGGAAPMVMELEGVNRPPQSMLVGDFDHDGTSDLILFTPSEPLVMVRSVDGEASEMQLLTDKTMPQFGLVQAAGPDNTAMLDIDGDGFEELLVADQNFVRACAFDATKGWRVVEQITTPESSASLVSLTVLPGAGGDSATIVASDKGNKRLVLMSKGSDQRWGVSDQMRFAAFDVTQVYAGAFAGDAQPTILAASESAFAVVRLAGQRYTLDEFAAFRSDSETRLEHELEVGDLNSDGFVDLVSLDAREQMCQIFTLSQSRRLMLATEFKVFESRLFGRGDDRQFEPSEAMIADVTGDDRADLILSVHDRLIIYPQMGGSK